ncbi:MAG: ribosome silencing factor [Prochlorothrix sp.]|nr:ribosome silencing factor [Prochlorothrix sp.]
MTESFPSVPSPSSTAVESTVEPAVLTEVPADAALALAAAEAADDRKGADITILRVTEVSYLADYFVLVTGFSPVQVKAIARSIAAKLSTEWDRSPRRVEGQQEGHWILQDFGDLIVHIFMPQEREFYNLEAFWGHGEMVPFTPAALSSSQEVR